MGADRLKLYFHTLTHIKPIQLYYQVYYKLAARFIKFNPNKSFNTSRGINFEGGIEFSDSLVGPNSFRFLNLEKRFETINWNINEYGKLWTYNLNYFDFLQQENISKEQGLTLINDFCEFKDNHLDAYEPYPISLRGINWVKFLSKHKIDDFRINQQLYSDYLRLIENLEYHLLGNHFLENGFGLLFGAYYFQDERLYKKAKEILTTQLEEQILADGAHYELAPMYHCIILHRILDCYNLVKNNDWHGAELAPLLYEKATLMLGWLEEMLFEGGGLPMVNDSTFDIAPTPHNLFGYAQRLNVGIRSVRLKESGYRKLKSGNLEILFDVGQIAPSYQPGHSHADSLQIVVYSDGIPLIVDTGISTYEKNERRQLERSTLSHNTVTVNEQNSSQVWSGFRVAKRAKVSLLEDEVDKISASHNGYKSAGIICIRKVEVLDGLIRITDIVQGSRNSDLIQGHLHLHPNVQFQLKNNIFLLNNKIEIQFPEKTHLEIIEFNYSQGFNDLVPSKKLIYTFKEEIIFSLKHL